MDMVGTKYTLNRVGVDGGVHGYWVGLGWIIFFNPTQLYRVEKFPTPSHVKKLTQFNRHGSG